jgi:hypothetical protein
MDITQLVKSILGEPGYKAMENLLTVAPEINKYVVPRTIVGWLRNLPYSSINKLENTPFSSLTKSGYGFSGEALIDNEKLTFQYVPEEYIAAVISIACNQKIEPIEMENVGLMKNIGLNLAKLGKTLDLLIKANINTEPNDQPDKTAPAQHNEPEAPIPAKVNQAKLRIPGISKTKKIKLTLSEKENKCPLCKTGMFDKLQFVGCNCFKPLAKSITTTRNIFGLVLECNEDIDQDAYLTLAKVLKNGKGKVA